MHGRAGNGRGAGRAPTGVPRPTLKCFATVIGIHKLQHPQLGEVGALLVESGDLQLEVHFPVEYAHPLGRSCRR